MDPLSITASTLTVLSALETAFQLINSFREAPSQLEALSNEVVDITATVKEVARVIEGSEYTLGSTNNNRSHLTLALSYVHEKARKLDVLLRSCVTRPDSTSDGDKISRVSWLKVRSRVQSLHNELRDGRLKLSVALAAFTASSSLRVELDVRDIFLVAKETEQNQQRLVDELAERRDQDRLVQDRFYAQVLAQLENFQLHQREIQHHLTDTEGKQDALIGSEQRTLQITQSDDPTLQVKKSLVESANNLPSSDSESNKVGNWSSIGIRAEARNLSECSETCKCSCHRRRRLSSPRLLDGLLGTLFIGYSGAPLLSQHCDQVSCQGRRSSTTSLVYTFPRWFVVSRMLQLKAKVTAMYGPEVSLRFNRVVNGKALVFHYATTGDVSKMKQLFEQGRASPSDVRYDSGWTPFHYAIQNNQVDVCKLLLQAGGDPYMETEAPSTAVDYAGAKVLGDCAETATTILKLHELFFDTQFLEHGNFSDLHKLILNIRPGNLEEELRKSTAALDAVDFTGRSPLSWAAKRGEAEAVRLLLEYGADPNNSDNTKATPLHYAAQAKIPTCLLLLIQHGAKITQQNRGWTALHYACSFHDDLTYIEPLLRHGADIDKRTYVGKTALSLAILQNHLKSASFLLSIGADPNVVDKDGQSPLALSIKFRRYEAMKLLLRAGAAHHPLSEDDDTLLHLVAKFPHLKIIQHLTHVGFGGKDLAVDAKNADGLTARECIQMHNSDPDIALAFQRLLLSLASRARVAERSEAEAQGDEDVWNSDSSAEDIFEDAIG